MTAFQLISLVSTDKLYAYPHDEKLGGPWAFSISFALSKGHSRSNATQAWPRLWPLVAQIEDLNRLGFLRPDWVCTWLDSNPGLDLSITGTIA